MDSRFREHHPSIYSPYESPTGLIRISGKSVVSLSTSITTPFYAYSRSIVEDRVAELRKSLPEELGLHYAVKANPNTELIGVLRSLVDGFDIASQGELQRLVASNVALLDVSFAGPGKTEDEIDEAITKGVVVVVESATQLQMCSQMAVRRNTPARCMVRINDHRQLANGGLSMTGSNTAFGWDLHDYEKRGIELFKTLPAVKFHGFHLFYGSQILQLDALIEGIELSAKVLRSTPAPSPPTLINLGGGLGIPYAPQDKPLDAGSLSAGWNNALTVLREAYPDVSVCIELGRYIVGPSGIYVTRVVDRKSIGDNTFLVTDGGMHHFAAATGNLGQVLKHNHPIWPAAPRSGEPSRVTVVGCLCTPIDTFAKDILLPPVEIGDLLVMFQAGAYGFSASPRGFLSHSEPQEVLL